jgi:hypothetical protein
MNLISVRFLGKTQLITEGTAIDLANQLAAKAVRPDFIVPDGRLSGASYLFYSISAIMLSLSIYLNVFYK